MFMPYRQKQISNKQSFFYSFSVDWIPLYWEAVSEQQLIGTQNWHQKDASALSNEAAPIQTLANHTGYTNHAT